MRTVSRLARLGKIVVRAALWFCACHLLAAALAAQCPSPTPVLTNQTVSAGTATYSDNNALATNANINGSASITLFAGHCIDLQPGFHATAGTAGTMFHAWVDVAPSGLSASPSSGTGATQQFTWTAASPAGYAYLTDVFALFATSINGQNACYIRYNQPSNLLYLADNTGGNWGMGFVPGSTGSAGNGQCSLAGSGSSVSGAGNQLTLKVSVTFQASYIGTQNDYLIAYDQAGLSSGWQQVGTWTILPDFTLSQPAAPTLVAGHNASTGVTIGAVNGFNSPVALTWANQPFWPYGLSASFVTNPVSPGATSSISVTTSAYSPPGTYLLTYSATGAGITHVGSFQVVIRPVLSASCAASASPVAPGTPVRFTAYPAGTPNYTYVWYAPASGGSPTSNAFTPAAASSNYAVTATVGDSTGQSVTAYCNVTTTASGSPDFSLGPLAPQTLTAGQGASAVETITGINGFNQQVSFSWSNQGSWPAGLGATFTQNPAIGSTGLWITTSSTTPPGTYGLNFTATGGGNSHTGIVSVTVLGPSDFSIFALPTSQKVAQGVGATYVVSITGGYSGTVGLSFSGLPAGASANLTPATLTGAGVTSLAVTTSATTPLGTFPIIFTATGGGIVHSTTAYLTVAAPLPASLISPTPGAFLSGGNAQFVWDGGVGASQFQLALGSTPGASNYFLINTSALQAQVSSLPTAPQTVYATLSSLVAGIWQTRSYAYQAGQPSASGDNSSTTPDGPQSNNNLPRNNERTAVGPYFANDGHGQPLTASQYVSSCYMVLGLSNSLAGQVTTPSQFAASSANTRSDSFDIWFSVPPSVSTGSKLLTCTVNGSTNTHNGPYVYDPPPSIDGISQDDPDRLGGPFLVRLYGRNFGSMPGSVTVCASSVDPSAPCNAVPEIGVCLPLSDGTPNPLCPTARWIGGDGANSEIRVLLTPLQGSAGMSYDFQVGATTAPSGGSFVPQPGQQVPKSNRAGRAIVPNPPTLTVTEFGWGNNQELWKATTFNSNGDSQIGSVVWRDSDGTNEPVALRAGSDTPYLSNIKINVTLPPGNTSGYVDAYLRVKVSPGDFNFTLLKFRFIAGQNAIPAIILSGTLPNLIGNSTYTFDWGISYSANGPFQGFKTTTHQVYLMHGYVGNAGAQYRVTTKRLDYVTRVSRGQSDLGPIITLLTKDVLDIVFGFDATSHIVTTNNVWAAMDSPSPLDCESLSAIVAAELQQLGYTSAIVEKAYPTGAAPPGDTDARSQEKLTQGDQTYYLTFGGGNFFEGFIRLNPPDTSQPMAATVAPASSGPLLGYTGCGVNPSEPNNLIAYRVLTSTYVLGTVRFQEWITAGGVALSPQVQIPLPNNNCPSQEVVQ